MSDTTPPDAIAPGSGRSPAATSRRRREPLTRERIVAAAIALADEQGIESVGMRSVARWLGVDPMSLYNHVDSKGALFDGIAARVVELADLPGPAPWDEWARVAANRFMNVALQHPGAFGIFGRHPVSTVEAGAHLEPFVDALLSAGFPVESCILIINAFFGFIASYAILRTTPPLTEPPPPQDKEAILAELRGRFPALSRIVELDTEIHPEKTYSLGIELLLDGLRAMLQREQGR